MGSGVKLARPYSPKLKKRHPILKNEEWDGSPNPEGTRRRRREYAIARQAARQARRDSNAVNNVPTAA